MTMMHQNTIARERDTAVLYSTHVVHARVSTAMWDARRWCQRAANVIPSRHRKPPCEEYQYHRGLHADAQNERRAFFTRRWTGNNIVSVYFCAKRPRKSALKHPFHPAKHHNTHEQTIRAQTTILPSSLTPTRRINRFVEPSRRLGAAVHVLCARVQLKY